MPVDSKLRCLSCPHFEPREKRLKRPDSIFNFNEVFMYDYCRKLGHNLENGYAVLYHSQRCGELKKEVEA